MTEELKAETEEQKRIRELQEEWRRLAHAVQSGVKQGQADDRTSHMGTPMDYLFKELKDQRTGINNALVGQGVISRLLIDKGICTELEYWEASVKGMEVEVQRLEHELTERHGVNIRLGLPKELTEE